MPYFLFAKIKDTFLQTKLMLKLVQLFICLLMQISGTHGQQSLLKFKLRITMRKKGELRDLQLVMVAGARLDV